MSLFKRGLYSVIRKPIKSLLLTAILYFIAVLLLMAVGISQQQAIVQREIENQVGGSFRLEINREEAARRAEPYNELVELFENSDVVTGIGGEWFYSLDRVDIDKISNVEGISDFNFLSQSYVIRPLDFGNDQSQASRGRYNPNDELMVLSSVRNAKLLDEVAHGFIKLQEGRWIEPMDEDSETLYLVISDAIAKKNNLSLGDTLGLEWEDIEFDRVLEHLNVEREQPIHLSGIIVGIFSVERPMEVIQNSMSLENWILTGLNFNDYFINQINEEERFIPLNNLAVFQVADVGYYEEIREDILSLDIDWELYNLVDADEMLSRLSSAFDGLHQLSSLMFGIVMAAGFAMLWLIFILWVRNRNHEIAILLAVGIEKTKIVSQFIFEALLVAVVAIALAVTTLPMASQFVDVGDLNTQFQPSDNEFDDLMGITGMTSDTTDSVMGNDFYEMATSSVTMNVESILIVMAALVVLIGVSIIIALVPVMKMKPRAIFSKMN